MRMVFVAGIEIGVVATGGGPIPGVAHLEDAVRWLPRKPRPVVMGPASRFACAGRRGWIWVVVIASEAKQSMAHPQWGWIASLRSQWRVWGRLEKIEVGVIPGCAAWRRPGIHNHERGLWIPGSILRIAPEW